MKASLELGNSFSTLVRVGYRGGSPTLPSVGAIP